MNLRERWRDYRRQGWQRLSYRGLRRILARTPWPGHAEIRVHRVIATPPWRLRLPPRLSRGMSVRDLSELDTGILNALRQPVGLPYEVRFAAHHRALGAFLEERLVAFVWLRCGPALVPSAFGALWQIAVGMTWVYDLYSDPEVLGAVTHLYAHLRRHPPGDDCRMLVGQTELDNVRSRLAHRSLGYETCATVCSLRLGRNWIHASHPPGARWWQVHAGSARIPLHRFTLAATLRFPAAAELRNLGRGDTTWLLCDCGRRVQLPWRAGAVYRCQCGRELGREQEGRAVVGAEMPYWGEIPRPDMERLLAAASRLGWRNAVQDALPESLVSYIAGPGRACFEDLLPIPPGGRILDVGAGWGGIAATLARRYDVVALEGVPERARFIALRRQQDRLERLRVLQGDLHTIALAPRQFDCIVANGILEWVALFDLGAPPREVQVQFLDRMRELLAPGGGIYLAIENRFGWSALRGQPDHSGLRYTSLMPRCLARLACARSRRYRSSFNAGYRTYTYSHWGYSRLAAQAGLRLRAAWFCPWGYNTPAKIVPFGAAPLDFCFRVAPRSASPREWLRRQVCRGALWSGAARWLASDFAFWLEPASIATQADAIAAPLAPAWREGKVANG